MEARITLATPIIGVKCHYCSRFFNPSELRIIGESVRMCWKCQERHNANVSSFEPPAACQMCGTSSELIAARQLGAKWSMFLHFKDGEYQMLCPPCSDAYIGKRKDLYGGTRFGWAMKLS